MSPSSLIVIIIASSMLMMSIPSAVAGGLTCEELPRELCAFAIASSSKRCVLESVQHGAGRPTEYECRTSDVVVERLAGWVETDECVRTCGVDRNTVGISSDTLLDPRTAASLCSPACFDNCPNIVDLYLNLAAGEGVFLPDLCNAHRANPHRTMFEILSSGAAPGPVSSGGGFGDQLDVGAFAPASSPTA